MSTTPPSPLRLAVIDDAADFRLLIRLALARSSLAVIAEGEGTAADLDELSNVQPDVLLLDYHLEGRLLATALIPTITHRCPGTMVAVCSASPLDAVVDSAIAAGAFVAYDKTAMMTDLAETIIGDHARFRSIRDRR